MKNYKFLKNNILLYGLIIIIILSLFLGNKKLYEGNTNNCCPAIKNCSIEHANANTTEDGINGYNSCVTNNQQIHSNCFHSCSMENIPDNSWTSMTCCENGLNIQQL